MPLNSSPSETEQNVQEGSCVLHSTRIKVLQKGWLLVFFAHTSQHPQECLGVLMLSIELNVILHFSSGSPSSLIPILAL